MKIYNELPTWHVDTEDESDSKYFMFKGEVVVEAYPDDEYHTDTVVDVYYPALVYCYSKEADYDNASAMTLDGSWELDKSDSFGGEWIGPIEFDDLRKIVKEDHTSLLLDELRASLENAYGMEPAKAVEYIIGVYKNCKSVAKFLSEVESSAKEMLSEIMEETGQLEWETDSGKCMVTKPGVSVRYDTGGLDRLAVRDPEMARVLSEYRKESQMAGSMRIT